MRVNWNPKTDKLLTELFETGKTDEQIATIVGSTKWGVGKRRSMIGLVLTKRPKGIKLGKRAAKKTVNIPDHIMFYNDGVDHFLRGTLDTLKSLASIRLQNNLAREVYIYSPDRKLVTHNVKEIML